MMLQLVYQARMVAQLVLALLVVTGAGRVAWTSFQHWWADEPVVAPASAPAAAPVLAPSLQAPVEPAPPPAGELVAVVLSVSHGEHRSQVFLDGMPLGHTAFVGDVTCRRGSDITIRIQPKRGEPIERVRRCEGGMISVREP